MPFSFKELPIAGAYMITNHIFNDDRGSYKKVFLSKAFEDAHLPIRFNESSFILAKKGSLRGLHYQRNNSQGKLITVVKGKIFDVFLDLRKESPSYLRHFEIELSDNDGVAVYIPEGCAHGFLSMSDDALFFYQSTNDYDPGSSGGIAWNDVDLDIPWPKMERLIISEKDKKLQSLKEYLEGVKQNG